MSQQQDADKGSKASVTALLNAAVSRVRSLLFRNHSNAPATAKAFLNAAQIYARRADWLIDSWEEAHREVDNTLPVREFS